MIVIVRGNASPKGRRSSRRHGNNHDRSRSRVVSNRNQSVPRSRDAMPKLRPRDNHLLQVTSEPARRGRRFLLRIHALISADDADEDKELVHSRNASRQGIQMANRG